MGIDIGGSGIKGAPINPQTGKFLEKRTRIPTPSPGNPKEIIKVIQQIVKDFDYQGKIGVGFPGVVRRGVIETVANINGRWAGENLAALIKDTMDCSAVVLNDADAAGLAEMRFGIGREYQDDYVLFLTVGTGIGSAFFMKGELWPNSELGHLQVRGKDAEHRAGDGERKKKKLPWKEWGQRFREVLRIYDFLFNPDVIILGGGISKKFDNYANQLTKINAEARPAKLRNQVGIIGAAIAAEESIIIE